MVERLEGWNKELYDKLSFEYLIECSAKNGKIEEWNQAYEEYLKSEWDRLFPGVGYDSENIGQLVDDDSGFLRPEYNRENFKNAIMQGANFCEAYLNGARLAGSRLEDAMFWGSHLEGAAFWESHLEGANFCEAYLDRSDFWYANLEKADFLSADLEGAVFSESHLEGANFLGANLTGAQFIFAIVDGETLFANNTIDDKTNFTGTSLSSARIEPELRTQLERNIREISWEKWYKNNKMLAIPARVFWKISDYGSSTRSILFTFLFSNVIFTMFYLALRDANLLQGFILSSGNDLLLAYMQTTLVPFGILGIDLTTLSLLPVFIIFLQVIFGYTILAALVTRMAIMFQNLSP